MAKAQLKMSDLESNHKLDAADDAAGPTDELLAMQANDGSSRRPLRPSYMQRPPTGNARRSRRPNQAQATDHSRNGRRPQCRAGAGQRKPPFPKELKKAGRPNNPAIPRTINGVPYYYCTTHEKWGEHPTHECKVRKAQLRAVSATTERASNTRYARAARALAAVAVPLSHCFLASGFKHWHTWQLFSSSSPHLVGHLLCPQCFLLSIILPHAL